MLKTLTINAITQYIDDNLESTSIDINTLVDYSGYSRRYLQLLFKNNMGISVGKYIQLRRITRAAILLRFTSLNIVDISERLFYDSQQTFTREFKKNSGYTPLQYRKNKIWFFKNMTGHREVDSNFPAPDIRFLERKEFNGHKILFKEAIPVINPLAKEKWDAVDYLLSNTNNPVFISHKIEDKKDNDNIHLNAVLWGGEGGNITSEELEEGYYACFKFKGTRDGYRKFTYYIYMNILPFYGLQKKDSYDLEVITKIDNDMCYYEYYLPIKNEEDNITETG
ncbi:helix-turn-helix domain-containing protein [Escherichia coli]|nr:helix-turn-helix domain-containing protein [Escherichia coli]